MGIRLYSYTTSTHLRNRPPKSPLRIFASFACALATMCTLEAAIVNGGFEDDAYSLDSIPQAPLTGWSKTPGPETTVVGEDTGLGGPPWGLSPHSGSIAARFSSGASETGAGASLSQAVVTDTAYTYDVSLWVANPLQEVGGTNNVFSLNWNGNLVALSHANLTEISSGAKIYVVASGTAWFQLLITGLPVAGTSTTLVISARNNDWATLVDDVVVQETPEPSTVLLLFTGAAILGMRRRRPASQVRGIE